MKIINKINDIFKENNNTNMLRNLFLLGLLGIVLLLAGNIFTGSESKKVNQIKLHENQSIEEQQDNYVATLSSELEETLSVIRGISEVKVQLLANEGISYVYEYNKNSTNKITSENDHSGGEREIKEENHENKLVVIKDNTGNEKPVIRLEKRPEIKGVIIVAKGAEVSAIKYEIYKTVSKFLDLPLHKINVLPYERS